MSEQEQQAASEGGIGQSASTGGLGCQGINDTSPACPHCGYKHDDAWEWNFGPGLEGTSNARECYRCGGVFDCERVVDVSYTTWVPNVEGNRRPSAADLGGCQWNMDKDSDINGGVPDLCGKPVKFRSPLGLLVCGTHRRTIDCNNAKYRRPERCVSLTPNVELSRPPPLLAEVGSNVGLGGGAKEER